jgi:hypothetical protein
MNGTATYLGTLKYGAEGATVMWLVGGVVVLTVVPTLFHHRMLKGEQTRWYLVDLGTPAAVATGVGVLSILLAGMRHRGP